MSKFKLYLLYSYICSLLLFSFSVVFNTAQATAHFSFATGSLSLPVVVLQDADGNTAQRYSVLLQLSADRQGFDFISAAPIAISPTATVDATFIPSTTADSAGQLDIPAVNVFNLSGINTASYQVILSFDNTQQRFLLDTATETQADNQAFQQFYL